MNISLSEQYEIQRSATEREFIRINTLERDYNRWELLKQRLYKLEKTIQSVTEFETEPGLILGELRQIEPMIDVIKKYKINTIDDADRKLESLTSYIKTINPNPFDEIFKSLIKDINRLQTIVNTIDSIEELKLTFINLTQSYQDNVNFAKKYFEKNPLEPQDYMEIYNNIKYGEFEMMTENLKGIKFIRTEEGKVKVDDTEYQRLRAISERTKKILDAGKERENKRQNTTISNFKVF